MVNKTDITIENGGSICNVSLNTDAARTWVADNLSLESWQWTGPASFAMEPRYVGDIVEGMIEDGLEVE